MKYNDNKRVWNSQNGLNGPLVHDFTHFCADGSTQDVPAGSFQLYAALFLRDYPQLYVAMYHLIV